MQTAGQPLPVNCRVHLAVSRPHDEGYGLDPLSCWAPAAGAMPYSRTRVRKRTRAALASQE